MASNYSKEPIDDEPKAKRPKLDTDASTSTKPKAVDPDPFHSLPLDIVAKIIVNIPVAQWPALELLDKHFRAATFIAWRQLRRLNVDREFEIKKTGTVNDRSTLVKSIESILRKLVEHSPFVTSLSGINIPVIGEGSENSGAIATLLGQFEHLQTISMGDATFFSCRTSLPGVVEFLESTRSRTSLKELRVMNVRRYPQSTILDDRLASSLVNGREIRSPLKLEKFEFSSDYTSPFLRLDTMDVTRLTELRVGKACIEPHQLIDLIERAPNLHGIELSFVDCGDICDGHHLDANKKLLIALSSHQNLSTIKFDFGCDDEFDCGNVGDEFIEMLKTIGRRGRVTKLSMEQNFIHPNVLDMDDVWVTIRHHIPYLRSIKIFDDRSLNDEIVSGIGDMVELEEINFADFFQPSANVMRKIARLPRLKRLAIDAVANETNSFDLKHLVHATKLTDLRIRPARWISADVFEKWAEVFAPNLEVLMLDGIAENDKHDEEGLVIFLEKAARLRVLILRGRVTNHSLMTIAKSCPKLEIFGVRSSTDEITVRRLQEVVDRCPRLKKLGGMKEEIRNQLHFPNARQIGHVCMSFLGRDFDDDDYGLRVKFDVSA